MLYRSKSIVLFMTMCVLGFMVIEPSLADTMDSAVKDAPKIEMDNGRIYYLVNSTVVERLQMPGVPVKFNVYDFDNGVLIHEFEDAQCNKVVTPFASLPQGRVDEVKEIGCNIFANEKRLVARRDSLDYFNLKFCQSGTP